MALNAAFLAFNYYIRKSCSSITGFLNTACQSLFVHQLGESQPEEEGAVTKYLRKVVKPYRYLYICASMELTQL